MGCCDSVECYKFLLVPRCPIVLICTFSFSPTPHPSHECNVQHAPSQLCTARLAVSPFSHPPSERLLWRCRPQIYAFGISHCLAFPSSPHHMFPSPLSLALILYFWDSICTALTDGRVIFTLSDTYMHTIDMQFSAPQTFNYTLVMKK